MNINSLLQKQIIWGGSGIRLIYLCNYWGVNPQSFVSELLKKYSEKKMTEEDFINIINEKLKKPVKKIKYNKENKRMSFKILGIRLEFTFNCPRTEDHCNIGSILLKLRKFIEKNELKLRNKTIDIKETQNWYLYYRLARNPQIKFLGMKKKKVKSH